MSLRDLCKDKEDIFLQFNPLYIQQMWVFRTELCVNYTEEVWKWVTDPDASKMLTQMAGLPSVWAGGLTLKFWWEGSAEEGRLTL